MKIGKQIEITLKDFLERFKPNKKCKDCFGRGEITRIYPGKMLFRRKDICHCVKKKYDKSEYNFKIKQKEE